MSRREIPIDVISIAIRFNDRINAGDPDGLAELMTQDHRFVDSAGNVSSGRENMRGGWKSFFDAWPDYKNVFERVTATDNRVIMLGRSYCTDDSLDGPAIWAATFEGTLIAEWRVWDDTPKTRRALGLAVE